MSEERSRLSRWSERKIAAQRGEVVPEPADEVQPTQEASVEPNQSLSAEGAPVDDEMPVLPPIEELTAESDYTVFLNAKVPEALRRAALRKLWTSDPVLANLDGLNDYDHDYNVIDTVISAAQSAYRAGRGYVEEVEEKLKEVEQALGEDTNADDESKKVSASGDVADVASVNQETVSDSDAAGDNSADAPREVTVAAVTNSAHPSEDSSE